jgi:hypothetical protein
VLCLALLVPASCGDDYKPFAENQRRMGLEAAASMRTSELARHIREVYEARIDDPERDGSTYPDRCGTGNTCVYSRAATAAWIRRNLAERLPGAQVREQRRSDGGFATTNILVDLPGHVRPAEWVIATAHYDAWFGGAVDNATGLVVTLEAMVSLARLGLDRSVRALLLDGEELGMVGSGRYVEEYGTDGVVMVFNADSVAFEPDEGGLFTGEKRTVEYWIQATERSAGDAFAVADLARRLPNPIGQKPLVFPGEGVSIIGVATGVDRSDQAQFWLARTPALFPFPAGDKPGFYHTVDDTPSRVDVDRLERIGRLWAAALAAFATVAR